MSSSDLAISARGLGKSYAIAHNATRPTNFREAIVERLRHPLGNGRQEIETFWALKDVDFEIEKGGVVGLIGRNGAGKSTLLKVLSRITAPTTGTIDIHGRVASLLEVGTGFHQELTGRENIFLNGSILGMTRREIRRKFDEIIDFSGVEKFLDTPVKRYSSGMYVRLAFAVAATLEPEILIVDEVLAVGDAQFQRRCIGKMQDISSEAGRTVFLVSHNMASITSLARNSLLLDQGKVVAYGPTDQVIDQYMGMFGKLGSLEPGIFIPEAEPGRTLVVKSLEILSRGRRVDSICMGDDLNFTLTLDLEGRMTGGPLTVGIGIETLAGVRVLSLSSDHTSKELKARDGEFRVCCSLGSVPLNHGQYTIRINVIDRPDAILESHERLGVLQVVPADVFGNGPMLAGQQGFFYWKSEWTQEDVPANGFRNDERSWRQEEDAVSLTSAT
jgi:lipopolysaccharide transport system ATP-binding protein